MGWVTQNDMESKQNNQTNEPKQKLLKRITLSYGLIDEYNASLNTAAVYSYMLCKYMWFKSKDKEFFESQPEIVKGSRVSLTVLKASIKFLVEKGLITIKKRKAQNFTLNVYTVVDRYGIYEWIRKSKKAKNQTKIEDFHEEFDSCPF